MNSVLPERPAHRCRKTGLLLYGGYPRIVLTPEVERKELIGNVFETSIFSELIKLFGMESVRYWRTKDKREIDFIVTRRDTPLPIEVKLNFAQCREKALTYFSAHYESDQA